MLRHPTSPTGAGSKICLEVMPIDSVTLSDGRRLEERTPTRLIARSGVQLARSFMAYRTVNRAFVLGLGGGPHVDGAWAVPIVLTGFKVEVCALLRFVQSPGNGFTMSRLDGAYALARACIEALARGWLLNAGAVCESDVPSQ
jgi:hypothetical protein